MKLLFFSPFSGIWEHASLEARVAEAFQKAGHEVFYATCGGLLRNYCVVMGNYGLATTDSEAQRGSVCIQCRKCANAIRRVFDFKGPELIDILDRQTVSAIDRAVDKAIADRHFELEWCGIPVGRRALYQFLIQGKRDNLDFTDREWHDYAEQLRQTTLAASAGKALIEAYRPDAVVAYGSLYSPVSSVFTAAADFGASCYYIEASTNLANRNSKGVFARDNTYSWYSSLRSLWRHYENRPAPPRFLREVTDHLLHLFKSASVFVYSTSSDPNAPSARQTFSIPAGSRVLVATLSSHDELFAAEEAGYLGKDRYIFASQIEWLDWLREYVSSNPELFLVIRVHPREFPNRREHVGKLSDNARRLQKHLVTLPPNCAVNWPSQNISLYDLAKESDVILNAWSSAGKEMGILGLPVVEWASDLLLYPPLPEYSARTVEEYRSKIELALTRGWSVDNIRWMYRWASLEYGSAAFRSRWPGSPKDAVVRIMHRILRRLNFGHYFFAAQVAHSEPIELEARVAIENALEQKAPTLAHLERRMDQRTTLAEETAALAGELSRVAEALFGRDTVPTNRLHRNLVSLSGLQVADG